MKQIKFKKLTIASLGFMAIAVAFQNCSEVEFATQQASLLEQCLEDETTDCGGETTITLRTIQPAVAVRGITCLMCHADIQANVITDFGYGNDYFFGGSGASINGVSWYNNYVNTWQSAKAVLGKVTVPNAVIPQSVQDSLGAGFVGQTPMTIAQLMATPYTAPGPWGGTTQEERVASMIHRVTPPSGPKVQAKGKIVIRAPSEADIASLSPALFNSAAPSGAVRIRNNSPLQLLEVTGTGGTYMMNDENTELQCANTDIIVKGTLYLRGLRVNAQGGCRIYVSGSVFIEDGITYATGDKQALQITSANGIVMGIGIDGLNHRLNDSRGLQLAGSRTYADRGNQTINEARVIGVLKDATTSYPSGRASINYSGLLLNAPMIQSRYLGVFKGTIIAEAAIFALGNFNFQFDPVITKVHAFPLLIKPIVAVQ